MEGTHHRGVDDAWNIAQLFCLLYKRMRRGE
jgi:inhibitor of KinA sporulation pathway (predicted exonuclease)